MILYGYGLSSASFRVRIALALKSVAYTSVIKNLRLGEHRLGEFLSVNSQGFVPTLSLDDGTILTQSVAILEYLDELYPDPPLLPAEPVARARVRGLSHSITSDVHPPPPPVCCAISKTNSIWTRPPAMPGIAIGYKWDLMRSNAPW